MTEENLNFENFQDTHTPFNMIFTISLMVFGHSCADIIIYYTLSNVYIFLVSSSVDNSELYPAMFDVLQAVAGLAADGRQIVARAKAEATNYERYAF